ncbi:uncharacterized protein LOC114300823 isoform X2 [Camellia sinensis]|uniref:uncharacterized protein LOC114300823 isoform X2 n=1 Tax=Camellia sinensis TaxID=4442 RepID=UPI001035FD63|nr:uncharacterized protein LOC114300823 isoform X2 [Camellia sinensis]
MEPPLSLSLSKILSLAFSRTRAPSPSAASFATTPFTATATNTDDYDYLLMCTFYQKGVCSYGSQCRYEHVKVFRSQSSTELAWQSNSSTSGMDANFTLRACPICRKVSYFVIPSVIWYSTKEEKQEIVDSYKAKHREAGNTSFLTYSLLYGENYLGSWRNYLKLDFAPR